MTSAFILNRITGKNYDFLKLSYFSYFREVEICINLVPSLSHPNNNIPQSHTPFKSWFLVEKSYTIRYSLSSLLIWFWDFEGHSYMGVF